jgi:hypothetical protein
VSPLPPARPLLEILHRLRDLGHAPEFPVAEVPFVQWVVETGGRELLRRYQEFHRLPATGEASPETLAEVEKPRCGCPDVMAFVGVPCWAPRTLTYQQTITFEGVAPGQVAAEYAEAAARIAAVCGIALAPAPLGAAAHIRATSAPIDGPWNVLALSELPPPNAPASTVLRQTFDVAEAHLGMNQRISMMCHELCHCLGLGHAPVGTGALMEPTLGAIDRPQPWDIRELQARYGPPPAVPAPIPPAIPIPAPPAIPAGFPAAAPAGPAATGPGPAVTSIGVAVPAAGTYRFDLSFDRAGTYLLLIVEPAPQPGATPAGTPGTLTLIGTAGAGRT